MILSNPKATAAALAVLSMAGCDRFPRDPDGTLRRVEGGVLVVGTPSQASLKTGERGLVHALAADLDARVRWIEMPSGDLMRELEEGRVDTVIGGVDRSDPWSSRVAFSRPYAETKSPQGNTLRWVIAVAQGENAFLLRIDRFIKERMAEDPG